MSSSVPNADADGHHNRFDDVPIRMAKGREREVNKVDNATKRARFGAVLRRAIELSGLTEKDVKAEFGEDGKPVDGGQFSRWMTGQDNAPVWKFHAHQVLGPALLAAQAEVIQGATIRTVIELQRRAVGL